MVGSWCCQHKEIFSALTALIHHLFQDFLLSFHIVTSFFLLVLNYNINSVPIFLAFSGFMHTYNSVAFL